jgi:hypothetical protein
MGTSPFFLNFHIASVAYAQSLEILLRGFALGQIKKCSLNPGVANAHAYAKIKNGDVNGSIPAACKLKNCVCMAIRQASLIIRF